MRSSSLTESNLSQLWLEMTRRTLLESQPSRLGVNLPRSLNAVFRWDAFIFCFPGGSIRGLMGLAHLIVVEGLVSVVLWQKRAKTGNRPRLVRTNHDRVGRT